MTSFSAARTTTERRQSESRIVKTKKAEKSMFDINESTSDNAESVLSGVVTLSHSAPFEKE